MKKTTRFITLVLTLILALSCSMQIFAEEVDPYAIPLCKHEHCMVVDHAYYEDYNPAACTFREFRCELWTCASCGESFYMNIQPGVIVIKHTPGPMKKDGKKYCTICFLPVN